MATSTVPIFDPQGVMHDVPYDQMNAAVQGGGKPAVLFQTPTGEHKYVPADQVQSAVQAGGKILPYEQQEVQHPSIWQDVVSQIKDVAAGVPSMMKVMAGPTPVPMGGPSLTNSNIAVSNPGGEVASGIMQSDAQRQEEGRGLPYRVGAAIADTTGAASGMEQAAREGDTKGVITHAATGAALAAAPLAVEGAARGAGKLLPDATRSVRASMPEETAGLPKGALQGAEDVYRASAPVGTNTRFRANVYAAAGDLAEIGREANERLKASKGGVIQPDMRTRVTVGAINDHLSDMYKQEREPQITNHAGAPVPLELSEDGQAGLNAMSRSGEAPVRAIARKAMGGQVTLAEADQLARSVNSELQKYESLDPAQQAAARVTGKSIAGLKELDRVLTEGIDDQLQIDGQPGIRSYERRYAALSAIRNQLEKRMNAAELNQGLKNSTVLRGARAVKTALTGGPTGIASASQAAVADVPQGGLLERGLGRLADSGIQANRARPRTPAPLNLTPPPGRVPPAGQDNLPFNEGRTQDMQTGPNGPLNLTGNGRVPPATQGNLNFNGADHEAAPTPAESTVGARRIQGTGGQPIVYGDAKDILSGFQKAGLRSGLPGESVTAESLAEQARKVKEGYVRHGSGANYTKDDLAEFKRKHNIR